MTAITDRAHLYFPIRDERGDLRLYARVRFYREDGITLYRGKVYRDGVSSKTYPNPYVTSPALVNAYFSEPLRLRLGIQIDTDQPEKIGDVLDITFDADRTVDTVSPLFIEGEQTPRALLCGLNEGTAWWKPLRVDHEHAGVAPNTTIEGSAPATLRQIGTFADATVMGADSGGWGAATSLRRAVMLGSMIQDGGRGTVAIGHGALAQEGGTSPWLDGALGIGYRASAEAEGVALGTQAFAGERAVALGLRGRGDDALSLSVGQRARSAGSGVAIGRETGATARGMPGSIGLGAGAQYGLPSSTASTDTTALLGAHDPTRVRTFPWGNPDNSQSESPFDEYGSTMEFTGRTVQLQQHLEWLADITGLHVLGDATLCGRGGVLGFHGAIPRAQRSMGDDEPSTGIPALDSLIYALRDLGLIKARHEAVPIYRAEDLERYYLNDDQVREWSEHFGTDTALSSAMVPPRYRVANDGFNRHPTVFFDNSVHRRISRPSQELRGQRLLPEAKHYIVVADHRYLTFGLNEGLVNLQSTGTPNNDFTILSSEGYDTTRWTRTNIARYERDGLDQTTNRDADLPTPHAYQVTHPHVWPRARAVIGGPRNNQGSAWDRWSGSIAEIVGMDSTWESHQAKSMAIGLMFKYHIGQQDSSVRTPSRSLILTQHDPMGGALVFWDQDYSDSFIGKVRGRAIRVPKPVVLIPFISIYFSFNIFLFRGSLVGNWGNLSFSSDYEVAISVKAESSTDDDVDIDVNFNAETEQSIGVFALNNNLTWSMGHLSSGYGYKICRIRHRITKVVVCISGEPPFRYADTDVKVYSTQGDGSLFLEGTVPLWGDGTFSCRVSNPGHKVARIVERSTGNILGSTEYQEKALPRTTVIADDDPDVSTVARDRASTYGSALTALAILDMAANHHYRSRHILSTLRLVRNVDGSLNKNYSAVLPAQTVRPVGEGPDLQGAIWTILAALRYQRVTSDDQFLLFARQLADFLITQPMPLTRDAVASYFAYRELGAVTGVQTYVTTAQSVRTALLSSHWNAGTGRWVESLERDADDLWATVLGGLFAHAIGDGDRARATVHHLKRYRAKGVQISAPHYNGPTGQLGYKPFADRGLAPHTSPPMIIDQAGTWAAVAFKLRFGEPAGDDVQSLYRWAQTTITADPTGDLYGQQFMSYSGNAAASPYSLRARPDLVTACWAHLLAHGARSLFTSDPLPTPIATNLTLIVSHDPASGRYVFQYGWQVEGGPAAAYEAVPEHSTDGGTTWSPVSTGSVRAPLGPVVEGGSTFSATWSTPPPEIMTTRYRVRVRLRNVSFGPWSTTPAMSLP